MKHFAAILFFILFSTVSFAQPSYYVHLTIDKVVLGNDSMVFKKGKTFLIETKTHTDTIEVTKVSGIPVAIVVDIRRMMEGPLLKYQIGYAWYKKIGNKWELIRNFGYVSRTDIVTPKTGFEKTAKTKPATEEYHCSIGLPEVFEAYFRMDVYKK
jgi:hypothetical protein